MNSNYGTPEDGDTKFDYEQVSWSSPVWTIKAVGNDNDSGLEDKELDGCVNFDTGIVIFRLSSIHQRQSAAANTAH